MRHASLFSGIGGAEIAASWVGWENVFHCEINPFCRKVLEYWFPKSISYEDIAKTYFTEWRGHVDVLTAGFPCQPFSVAGLRKGTEDNRYLWPQVVRVIREIRPAWVIGENVAGILTMVQPSKEVEMGSGSSLFEENRLYRTEQQYVIETICQDLEHEGYSIQPFVIPACAVGAPHRRDRVWIIAHRSDAGVETVQCGREDGVHATGLASYTDINRQRERTHQQVTVAGCKGASNDCSCSQDEAASDTRRTGRKEQHVSPEPVGQGYPSGICCEELQADRWAGFPTESPICSRDDGLSLGLAGITFPKWRSESIKAMGNAWVPQVVYEIFKAINESTII